jgi:hypothetical protein
MRCIYRVAAALLLLYLGSLWGCGESEDRAPRGVVQDDFVPFEASSPNSGAQGSDLK